MNPVRMSKEWPGFLRTAIDRGLKSHEVGKLTNYVDEKVNAGPRVKLDALGALVEDLRKHEADTGTGRKIYPVGSGRNGKDNVPPIDRDREG